MPGFRVRESGYPEERAPIKTTQNITIRCIRMAMPHRPGVTRGVLFLAATVLLAGGMSAPAATRTSRARAVPAQVAWIAAAVKARQPGPFVSSNALVNSFFHTLLYTVSMPRMGGSDKKFFVQETCNRCGLCEKVCPVQNIRLVDGRPAWQHHCEQCMACLQWCPQEAIQFGKATIGRRRYRHPEFKAADFMLRGQR